MKPLPQFLRVTALNANPLTLSDSDQVPHVDIQIGVRYPVEADFTKVSPGLTDSTMIAELNSVIKTHLENAGFTVDTVNPDHPSGQYPPVRV